MQRTLLSKEDKEIINTALLGDVLRKGCLRSTIKSLLQAKKCKTVFEHFSRKGFSKEKVVEKIYRYFQYLVRIGKIAVAK